MTDLQDDLRKLGKDKFESLICQLLLDKYPGAGIKGVEGAGGDQGIDYFSGTLAERPAIWQSKHFPDGVKLPQRRQVLKSIKSAFENRTPSTWTLCVPVNLTTKEHAWFQENVRKPYQDRCKVELMQATDILRELINNRRLRDAFFPISQIATVVKTREIMLKNDGPSPEEMTALAEEFIQQYLDRKSDIDPRLRAVVSYGQTPRDFQIPQHGLVATSFENGKTTSYFARDVEAFNLDPITLEMSFGMEVAEKLQDALDAGEPIHVPSSGIHKMTSSSPLLRSMFGEIGITNFELFVKPSLPPEVAAMRTPLRLIAGQGETAKEIPYLLFKFAGAGRRQLRLTSEGPLPISVTITLGLPPDESAGMHLSFNCDGTDVRDADVVLQFLQEVERSKHFQVESVEFNSVLFQTVQEFNGSFNLTETYTSVIRDAAIVSRFFDKKLRVPEKIFKSDVEHLETLKRIATGESFNDVSLEVNFIVDDARKDLVLTTLLAGDAPSIRIDVTNEWQTAKVFGQEIGTGPVSLEGNGVTVLSLEETKRAYKEAAHGTSLPIKVHCSGPCHFIAVKPKKPFDPRSAFTVDVSILPKKAQ